MKCKESQDHVTVQMSTWNPCFLYATTLRNKEYLDNAFWFTYLGIQLITCLGYKDWTQLSCWVYKTYNVNRHFLPLNSWKEMTCFIAKVLTVYHTRLTYVVSSYLFFPLFWQYFGSYDYAFWLLFSVFQSGLISIIMNWYFSLSINGPTELSFIGWHLIIYFLLLSFSIFQPYVPYVP